MTSGGPDLRLTGGGSPDDCPEHGGKALTLNRILNKAEFLFSSGGEAEWRGVKKSRSWWPEGAPPG